MRDRLSMLGILASLAIIPVALLASATATAAPSGAAVSLNVAGQTCESDGTVTAEIAWTTARSGPQWFDVSAIDDDFASEYARGGPYRARVDSVLLRQAVPDETYYIRVWTWSGSQWLASDTLAYQVRLCNGAPPPPSNTEMHAASIEDATVAATSTGYSLHVIAGQEGGCDLPYSSEVTQQGTLLDVGVINIRATGQPCTLIYGTYELDIDLGNDFTPGVTYTVNVNDEFTLTFTPR